MKKVLSMMLVLVMLLSMVMISVDAAEIDVVDSGTASHTQAEAVQWVNGKIGAWVGSGQCVALIEAYCSYLGLSVSGGDGNACDYTGARNISDSTRINNYNGFVPQPGDICVWGSYAYLHSGYQTKYYGHIGIVLSADASNMTTVECNLEPPYEGGVCKKITQYRPTKNVTCFIRPNFQSPVVKPTNAYVNVSNSSLLTGKSNTFTFGAKSATSYDLTLYKNDTQYAFYSNVKSGVSYTFNEEGNYSVTVTAKNSYGSVTSSKKEFFVMNALDLGSFFVAKVKNPSSEMFVAAGGQYDSTNYPNVYLASETSNSNNEWMFERQNDFSYKVTNVETGYCLDVSGGSSANGTNIGCYPSNDTASQRWYIRTNMSDGYALVPKLCLTSDLSIYGNNSLYNNNIFDGANIALCGNDSVKAQRFVFDYIVTAPNEWIQIDKTELTSKEKLTFNFGANGATKYTLCVDRYDNRELTEEIQTGDSFSFDKTGDYSAYVLCTIGDDLATVKTPTVSFYNLLVYDYGEKFTANIKNSGSDYYITTGKQAPNMSYPDVYIASKMTDGSSEWLFERQSDYSYKITNQKTGYVLDLYGGMTDNLTNIDTFPDNGTDSQRWFISNNMDGHALVPMNNYHSYLSICGNNSIYGECIFDGANIALYGLDNVKSQRFSLENITDLSATEPTTILGDADGDGEVSSIDATLIQRYDALLDTEIDEDVLMNGDVDGNGELEIIDATWLQRYLAYMDVPYLIDEPIG